MTAAPEDLFSPQLNFQYDLPLQWTAQFEVGSMVIYGNSAETTVTITERQIEPWRFPTALALGVRLAPTKPAGWTEWLRESEGAIKRQTAYQFVYRGVKDTETYVNVIQWYKWGDVHVQVSAELPAFHWDLGTHMSRSLTALLESFVPHDGEQSFAPEDALGILALRMDDRPAGIFARDEVKRGRVEMTCRDIYLELNEPTYFGDGTWEMSAFTLSGQEAWRVYEPNGSVAPLAFNDSTC